ncbi:MAG: insulinase family protein [Acidobacteria bacterium]|nr:insulinase family protein [Acidobacteriota bacterium]
MKRLLAIALALAILAPTAMAAKASAGAASPLDSFVKDVKRTRLSNGLTVLTREEKGTGVVTILTWVKAGYFNEPDEVAGMAHLFEHMFFKGSKKFPGAEQISEELALVGGQTNAGTIYDSTSYYFVVPREGFRRAMEIQADAVINPLFDPAELKKEAEVVIEESNRKYDNAPAVSAERMFATSFTQHRMKRWRIGSNEVLRSIERPNLLAFFETLYRPENMILTITGDVSHDEALRLARETFGKLPKGKLDKKYGPKEPAQTEFRYGSSTADIKQGYSVYGWQTVGVGADDELALDVLSVILGGGRSSRLYTGVVSPDAASTVNASHFTFDDIGVFSIQASFDEQNRARADERTLGVVERMRAYGPNPYELQLAKNSIESELVFELQSSLGQAQTLAQYEARYGYEQLSKRLAKLKALSAGDIAAAAKKYLTVEKLTLYHYAPKGTQPMTREAALESARAAMVAGPAPADAVAMPATPAPVNRASADKPVRSFTLANGATLLVRERRGAPLVSTGIYFPGGRIDENSRNAGITQLTARSMRKGTASRSGEEIDRAIEFLGTQIGIDVNEDFFGMTLGIVASNYSAGLELLADVVQNPTFPEKGVVEEKAQQVAAIRRSLDSSQQRPFDLAAATLYSSHPYGLPSLGYQSSLAEVGPEALRAWWRGLVVSDGALIVVVGDVDAEAAKALIEKSFSALPRRQKERMKPAAPVLPAARLEVAEFRDRKQSAIVYAYPTVTRTHPDWPAVRLLGNITSGLAGTFFAELRGRQSLAYTVFARDTSRVEHGTFVAYMATDAAKEKQAKDALLHEIRRLGTDGITQADLDRAKSSFAGSTKIFLQTNGAILSNLASHHFHGVGLDFTERLLEMTSKLTLDQVRAMAKKYLSGDNFVGAVQSGKS